MQLGPRHFSDRLPAGVGDLSDHPIVDADAGEVLIHVQPSVAVVLGRRPRTHPSSSPPSPRPISLPPRFTLGFFRLLNCLAVWVVQAGGLVERRRCRQRLRRGFPLHLVACRF